MTEQNQHSEPETPKERAKNVLLVLGVTEYANLADDARALANDVLGLVEQLQTAQNEAANWCHEYDEACKSLSKRVQQGAEAVRRERGLKEQLEAALAERDDLATSNRINQDALGELQATFGRFEDEVRDVMDFMPHDKHYEGLNEALGRIRAATSNPASEPKEEANA